MSYQSTPALPAVTGYDQGAVTEYLNRLHAKNRNAGFSLCQYAHGAPNMKGGAYYGGCYSPTQNRIYLAPFGIPSQGSVNMAMWHYIDCTTGKVVEYASGVSIVQFAYIGGVYSPLQDRIYLVPMGQGPETYWHYIDCRTGTVVPYTHTGSYVVTNGYAGGCYSPTQNRIYFAPYSQMAQTYWHYIDCGSTDGSTGGVTPYSHPGSFSVSDNYVGSVYSPASDRIYFIPTSYYDMTYWHYIDCATGSVVPYTHTPMYVSYPYECGVYSPLQDRIYLTPYAQSNQAQWHYIDCATAAVVAYDTGISVGFGAYTGGAYSPTTNRIYLAPYEQSSQPVWHYIDCNTGSVVPYTHGTACVIDGYLGAVYSPTQGRAYMIPYLQGAESSLHYVQDYALPEASITLMSSAAFNKF